MKDTTNMAEVYEVLNKLIKEGKIKFNFYNNNLLSLDLIQFCHNKTNDTLEMSFRDIMAEHITELKEIMKGK